LAEQHPELIEMLEKIAQGHAVDGMEALSPALVDGMELLVDLVPADTVVLVSDPELVRGRALELVKTSAEFLQASWAAAAGGGRAPIDLVPRYQPLGDAAARPRPAVRVVDAVAVQCRTGRAAPVRTEDGELVDLSARVNTAGVEARTIAGRVGETYRGDTESAITDVAQRLSAGWRVAVVAEGRGTRQRLAEVLSEHDLPFRLLDRLDQPPSRSRLGRDGPAGPWLPRRRGESRPAFTTADLSGQRFYQGEPADAGTLQNQIVRNSPGARSCTARRRPVCRRVQRSVAGSVREYLVIEYASTKKEPRDRLYVRWTASTSDALRRR
jgi:transcription-repair coupling factor (superfamily II helicase)